MTHRPCRVLCREEFADEPRSFDNWCTKNAEAYVNPSNNWYTQRCRNKAVGNSVGVAKLKEFCSVVTHEEFSSDTHDEEFCSDA
jgi:hypothetical protein